MPALIVGHAPVHTQAFTFEADVGFPVADQGFAHTVEATVQAAVPHEKTGTVSIAAAGFTDKQVRADLQALVVQFQARGRRCTVSDGGRKEGGPLAGDRVGGCRRVALGQALGERTEGGQAQATGTDWRQR
ncbi:hypothetical protein D3C84_872330 [compost metagenome]